MKIEDTESGDCARWMEPAVAGYGIYFHALNRNKKSIKLNPKTEDEKGTFKKLEENGYDVIVESFRPRVIDKIRYRI